MGAFLAGLSRGLKVFLVADLVLVVGVGVAAILLLGGEDEGPTPSQGATMAASATVEPTGGAGVPSAESSEDGSDEDTSFTSPTGNIFCSMTVSEVSCEIGNISSPPAGPEGCTGAGTGHVVTLDAEGVHVPCLDEAPGDTAGEVDVLDYGSTRTVGDFTCTSASDGMSCVEDSSGTGFRLASAGMTPLP